MTRLAVAIVDDEPLAQRRLHLMLSGMSDLVAIAGVADSVDGAVDLISVKAPDVILLDVRMRDGLGFDLLDRVPPESRPIIIFVTAFADHAVQAFDAEATDYILKPVRPQRLRAAIERARRSVRDRDRSRRFGELQRLVQDEDRPPAAAPPPAPEEGEFWIRQPIGGFVRVSAAAIDWACVEEDYVRIHVGDRSYLLRDSVRGLLMKLAPSAFAQIHRTAIVRIAAIAELTSGRRQPPEVVLHSGTRLKLGRAYAREVRHLLRERSGAQRMSLARNQ